MDRKRKDYGFWGLTLMQLMGLVILLGAVLTVLADHFFG
jgi:hypothetical protein